MKGTAFGVPVQVTLGLLGLSKNETITLWAQEEAAIAICETPETVMTVALESVRAA